MGLDEFKTIATTGEGTYSEKRSKFLAFSHHVESVDEVKDLVQAYRKKYYDARHVCYAYVLGPERDVFRANDDGEPSSTAGKPILGQINSNGLTDILVVVVRYYGGVNLGTGGLIVAYKTAAAEAIAASEVVTRQVEEVVTFSFPYVMMNSVMHVHRLRTVAPARCHGDCSPYPAPLEFLGALRSFGNTADSTIGYDTLNGRTVAVLHI